MTTATRHQLSYLHDQLEDLEAKGLHYRLRVLEGEQKPIANFDGKEVINLSSNNYLGLTTHRALRRAALEATRRWGVGAGAVRSIAGTMKIHMELEEQIARFKQTESCVVFQSGFTANAGTVAAILGKDDLIISDELNHASIIDGVFSMDGDIAPLPQLCDLAEKYNCIMMVDDAHSSGVLGRGGRGTVDH